VATFHSRRSEYACDGTREDTLLAFERVIPPRTLPPRKSPRADRTAPRLV